MKKIICQFSVFVFMLLVGITTLRADDPPPYDYQGLRYAIVEVPYFFKNNEPWVMRIRTQEEWQALYTEMWTWYSKLSSTTDPQPSAPSYDFEHYELVIGGMGRPKPCYVLKVAGANPGGIAVWGMPYQCPTDGLITNFADASSEAVLLPKTKNPINIFFKTLSPETLQGIPIFYRKPTQTLN
jgi:hypothetical protein